MTGRRPAPAAPRAEIAAAPPRSSAREIAGLALVLAAAAWLQAGSLAAPFFADDFLFLDQARARSFVATLASPDPIGNYFRPLSRQVWFWTLATFSGESARLFHLANLALFLGVVALTFAVARRLLPAAAALAAAAVVAVHHAADVPVLWASGSQDLLAVALALTAVLLHASGRTWLAAAATGLALLSKETVALAPLVAVAVARRPVEPWRQALRRAWPLFAALGVWLVTWLAVSARRPGIGSEIQIGPAGLPAALAHLMQVALGVEWPSGDLAGAWRAAPPLALIAALAGIGLAAFAGRGAKPERPRGPARRQALAAGVAWAALGALPVAGVAGIWSAYHYLFAVCGVALAAGALVAGRPAWVALLPALLVGFASENARRLPEFATRRDPWATQSHLNRHYLARGMALAQRCLADLQRARPTLPGSSTLFFAGIPAAVAFQAADGPLIRWAYRDSSLRSHYLSGFQLEHAARGPVFFFQMSGDSLTEITGPDSLSHIGLGLILGDAPEPAGEVLALAFRHRPQDVTAYWAAWTAGARGDRVAMLGWLERAGVTASAGPAPQIPMALARVAAGDTVGAIALIQQGVQRHGLDPGAHALMADLLLTTGEIDYGTIEAYAARVLAPEEPSVWRRWGLAEAVQRAHEPAERALERYLALAGPSGAEDAEVQSVLATLRRQLPGGDLVREELGRLER